jgi:tol-pal system protein YbgF
MLRPQNPDPAFRLRSAAVLWAALGAGVAMLVLAPSMPASAQDVQAEELPAVKAPAGKTQKAPAAPTGGSGGADAGLRQRVEQLEGQLVDLQVVIGTLESLARTGGAAPAPVRSEAGGGLAGGDRGRLDTIETQIRALTAQVEQLSAEVRAAQANGGRRSDAGAAPGAYGSDAGAPQTSRFGSTTVTSDNAADPIGALAGATGRFPPSDQMPAPQPDQMPAPPPTYGASPLPPPGGGQYAAADPQAGVAANPKQLYETAYGYLLQQDYPSAQAGFREFLKSYPQDALAPNALYWLGESHYVQKNYSDAAEAFDLVVSTYGNSSKAPDAQLKRGMALAQLGKREEACATLRGVSSKFPGAPVNLKAKADGERQRIGCP